MAEPGRLALAAGNLGRLDLSAAVRSIFSPDSLSPVERKTLLDDFLPQEDGIVRRSMETITDPLFMIGMALHFKFPIAPARELFKVGKRISALKKTLIPGLSHLQPFESMFAGETRIINTLKSVARETKGFQQRHVTKLIDSLTEWEKATGRQFKKADEILLGVRLDGLEKPGNDTLRFLGMESIFSQRKVDAIFRNKAWSNLESRWRTTYSELFDEALKGKGDLVKDFATAVGNESIAAGDIEKLRDFLPHLARRSAQSVRRSAEVAASRSGKQFIKDLERITTKHINTRHNRMAPSIDDLRSMNPDLFTPGAIDDLEGRLLNRLLKKGVEIPEYTLRATHATSSYIHSVGRFHGYTGTGNGKIIAEELQRFKNIAASGGAESANANFLARTLEGFAGAMKQKNTMEGGTLGYSYISMRNSVVRGLESLRTKVGGPTMDKAIKKIQDFLIDGPTGTITRADQDLAGFFYLNTLGINPSSGFMNLLQTFSTTGPLIGASATAKGAVKAIERMSKYYKLRLNGTTANKAADIAFADAKKAGVVGEDFLEFVLRDAETALSKASVGTASKVQKVKNAMMFMFTESEKFNRLTAFEGGLIKATREGLKKTEAIAFATQVSEATQFFADGPLATPFMFLKAPKSIKQFMTFTTRLADFTFGTGSRAGSSVKAFKDGIPFVGGRNLGTLGRMLATASVASSVGQGVLGADISNGLLFGGLPAPKETGPFSPAPVSPLLQLIGAGLSDVASGEFDELQRSVGLLLPGGVALTRASTLFSPKVAQALGKEFVDFSQRDQNGLIPLFSSNGSLKGKFTEFQLIMKAAGLPFQDITATNELANRMRTQSRQIREIRKRYMQALLNNDSAGAERINLEYQQNFGGLGIDVRPQDLEAARFRGEITQLERIARNVPGKENKAQMFEAIQLFIAAKASRFNQLGVDPALLSPTMSAREIRQGGFTGIQPAQPLTSSGIRGSGRLNRGRFTSQNNPQSRDPQVKSLLGSP